MITKYKINKDELIINIDFLYDIKNKLNSKQNIIKYINLIFKKEKIKFKSKKITIYQNGILIGIIYLTTFYLKKIKFKLKEKEITEKNCYFYPTIILELNQKNKKINTKKVFSC